MTRLRKMRDAPRRALARLALVLGMALASAGAAAPPAAAAPVEVKAGMFLTSLSGLTPALGSFRVIVYAWFIDPSGSFEPARDIVVLARSAERTPIARRILPDGSTHTIIRIDAIVDHSYDIRRFPFDTQRLRLQIEATDDTASWVLVPDHDDTSLAEFVQVAGWRIVELDLESSAHAYQTGFGHRAETTPFSRLTMLIAAKRNRSPLIIEKFTGFVVALAITAMVTLVPAGELGTRVGMMTGSVFAAVINRYRLEDAIAFDSVFGLVDQVTVLTFSAILSSLGLSLRAHYRRAARGLEDTETFDRKLGGAVLAAHVALIIVAFAVAMA